MQLCVCLHKGTQSELRCPTATPTRRKQLVKNCDGETKVDTERGEVRNRLRFPHRAVCQCARAWLCIFFYSAVVIMVIIYHYSGRGRKIVSTDDMGAVCRACCNSRGGETLAR